MNMKNYNMNKAHFIFMNRKSDIYMVKITNKNKEMIKKHVSIEALASEYFSLKRGRNGMLFITGIIGNAGDSEHDFSSLAIYPDTNKFYRYSCHKSGDVIEFVQETKIEGIDNFQDACKFLMKRVDPDFQIEDVPIVKKEKLSIVQTHESLLKQLNERLDSTSKYVIAYLISTRKIDKEIVYSAIERGYIKPLTNDKNMKTVGFVGYSPLNTIASICERSVSFGSKFKRDFENCDYEIGWTWYPQNEEGNKYIPEKCKLIVSESYISMMSYMSLLKETDPNWNQYVYHSTGSVTKYPSAINAIQRCNPDEIIIAGDNDKWGLLFFEDIKRELAETPFADRLKADYPIVDGADWNDILKEKKEISSSIGSRIKKNNEKLIASQQISVLKEKNSKER